MHTHKVRKYVTPSNQQHVHLWNNVEGYRQGGAVGAAVILGFEDDDLFSDHVLGKKTSSSIWQLAFGERAGLSKRAQGPAAQLISIIYSSN